MRDDCATVPSCQRHEFRRRSPTSRRRESRSRGGPRAANLEARIEASQHVAAPELRPTVAPRCRTGSRAMTRAMKSKPVEKLQDQQHSKTGMERTREADAAGRAAFVRRCSAASR